jgi:cysteinyl-tRNA synthetase
MRLYNTATRAIEPFSPVEPGHATIYACGATVQGPPHLGHARTAVVFDVLRRWLEFNDMTVTFIRNVTDIDDKVLHRSQQEDAPWWAVASRYERDFLDTYTTLGCLPATHEPRATGHIIDMVTLTERLIDGGHAYVAGSGNVYFAVRSWPAYGALSKQDAARLRPTSNEPGAGKRDDRDFALWKAPKEGEPTTASWPTPWGRARPGWHLECSAMSTRYLGPVFDIHGGGRDLIFPHHENELAQSTAAGDSFARVWMHTAWLTVAGEKMSKSLGNSHLVRELLQTWKPVHLRYLLVSSHYRSVQESSSEALAAAAHAYDRIETFMANAVVALGAGAHQSATASAPQTGSDGGEGTVAAYSVSSRSPASELFSDFAEALDDDLSTPRALVALHAAVARGNVALSTDDLPAVSDCLGAALAMRDLLGLSAAASSKTTTSHAHIDASRAAALDLLVTDLLLRRQEARDAQDFAAADDIRDQLLAAGVSVEDTVSGSRWRIT